VESQIMETWSNRQRSTFGSREALMTGRSAWVRLGSIAVAAGLLALACTDTTDVNGDITVTVSPATSTLASIGEQTQLAATVSVTRGTAPSPVWVTRNVDVAGVGDDGRVRAVGNGETWIVALAEANGIRASDSAKVVVSQVPVALAVAQSLDTLTWLGATTRLSAVAMDALGNPLTDAPFAWTSSAPALASVDSAGTVTAVANGSATIVASLGGVQGSVTMAVAQEVATVTVTPASPAISVGATQQFAAEARDAGNTVMTGVNFLWVSANANVAVVDTTGLATGTGVGAVTITAVGRGEPGNAVLSVGASSITPTQVVFTVQPTTSTAGQALSPAIEVELRDVDGNLVTGARNSVTLAFAANPGSGTLAGTKTVTAVNGIASFSGLWIDKAAAGYTLQATSPSLTSATSLAFTINPGAPTRLAFGAQPTNAAGNTVISPAITATIIDAFGNVATGATNPVSVDFDANIWKSVFSPGATLIGTKTANAVAGVATFGTLRVDKPGSGYTLAASASGLTGATSNPFGITLTVQQVSASKLGSHTCAVTSGGPYCWGYGGSGQLGDGTGTVNSDSVARVVSGGLTFTQVSAGSDHTCGITGAGVAYCWGYNGNGQLGNNSTTPSNAPVAVSGGLTFTSITGGISHTCGVAGTALYCWGNDQLGQLGDDAPLAQKLVPTIVAGGLSWASVATGYYHTCGRTTAGDLYCWGWDGYGQLGNDATLANSPTPVVVAGGQTWGAVDAAYYQTCAVNAAGAGYCWGYHDGRLGADTVAYTLNTAQGTPLPVFGALTWSSIKVGWDHSCGLTTTGVAYCWGYNYDGQFGNGSLLHSKYRVAVNGGLTFDSITAGGSHNCGRVGSAVWCWGYNGSGQLGDGSRLRKTEPVQMVQ
jgi:alpha-tubulin suppressor-like RCC1 family protein